MTTEGKVPKFVCCDQVVLGYQLSILNSVLVSLLYSALLTRTLSAHLAFSISGFRGPSFPFEIAWHLDSRSTVFGLWSLVFGRTTRTLVFMMPLIKISIC